MKVTDYLAIYAACLSTIVFFWNVFQSKPKIKVDLIHGLEEEGEDIKTGVYVFVRNLSSHDVYLSNISVLYPYGKASVKEKIIHFFRYKRLPLRVGWVSSSLSNYEIDDRCPVCVGGRQSHSVLIPDAVLKRMLEDSSRRHIVGCVQDQLWRNTYSKVFKL